MRKLKINRHKNCFDFIKYYLIFLCLSNTSNLLLLAQIKEITPLTIGANIPDEIWDMQINVMNNSEGKNVIKLREYKGKLILLDFWGTYCSSCISGFPHLMEIQERNKEKVVILAISNEGKEKLENFFNKGAGIDRKIFTSFEERTLAKYFPHRGIPHTIWISPEGKYLNPTNTYEITQENINAVLSEEKSSIKIKLDIDRKKPLLISDNFYVNKNFNLGFYSIFFNGYCPGCPSGSNFKVDDSGKVYGRQWTNKKLSSIVRGIGMHLFDERAEHFTNRRVILNCTKPLILDQEETITDQLPNHYYYNYELIVPKQYVDSLYSYMLADLNRYLDIKMKVQKMESDCLVLIRSSKKDKLKSKGMASKTSFLENKSRFTMSNESVELLVSILNEVPNSKLPIINETGYIDKIDIDLQGINDLKQLKNSLKKFDLDLIQVKRSLLMYVIEDK